MTRRQRTTLFLSATAAILMLAGATYTVYWFYVAARIPAAVASWAADQGEDGYDVAYSDVEVSGFPGPFRIHVTDPIVSSATKASPGSGKAAASKELSDRSGAVPSTTTFPAPPR